MTRHDSWMQDMQNIKWMAVAGISFAIEDAWSSNLLLEQIAAGAGLARDRNCSCNLQRSRHEKKSPDTAANLDITQDFRMWVRCMP